MKLSDFYNITPPVDSPNGTTASDRDDILDIDALKTPNYGSLEDLYVVPPEEIEAEEQDGSDIPVVGKPQRQEYFRVHPTSWVVPLLKFEATGDFCLCQRTIKHPDIRDFRLFLMRTHLGNLRLWPVPTPRHGDDNPAAKQQRAIAAAAMQAWAWMRWQGGKAGYYRTKTFPTYPGIVTWPQTVTFDAIVVRAFADQTINSADDPRLLELPDASDDSTGHCRRFRVRSRPLAALYGGEGVRHGHPVAGVGGRVSVYVASAFSVRPGHRCHGVLCLGGNGMLPRSGLAAPGPYHRSVRRI